jgi:hypothetical protein
MTRWLRACRGAGFVAVLSTLPFATLRCSANLSEVNACHYFADKVCAANAACGASNPDCSNLENECNANASNPSDSNDYPSGYEIQSCADAISTLGCGTQTTPANAPACFNSSWDGANWMAVSLSGQATAPGSPEEDGGANNGGTPSVGECTGKIQLETVSGNDQEIAVGSYANFTVEVVNCTTGAAVSGMNVMFQEPGEDTRGYIATTDSTGQASATNFVSSSAGTYTETASIVSSDWTGGTGFVSSASSVPLTGTSVTFTFYQH